MATTVQLASDSMFLSTPVYQLPGQPIVFGLRIQSLPKSTDRLTQVTGALVNRSDLISSYFQGDQALWWLLADLSQIVDPLLEFTQGTNIRLSATGLNR